MSINFGQAIDLGAYPPVRQRWENLATAPSSPGLGYIYYNTTDNAAYFWNGTAWKPVAGTNIVVVSTMPASPVANTLYIVTT